MLVFRSETIDETSCLNSSSHSLGIASISKRSLQAPTAETHSKNGALFDGTTTTYADAPRAEWQ
jgi:hypothetical protein